MDAIDWFQFMFIREIKTDQSNSTLIGNIALNIENRNILSEGLARSSTFPASCFLPFFVSKKRGVAKIYFFLPLPKLLRINVVNE